MTTRRSVILGAALWLGAAALPAVPALAQDTVDLSVLAQENPLGDIALGQADAPVTVIEYGSLSCPHCAAFDVNGLPVIQQRYIDTGIVRYIYRDYPLEPYAMAGAMLARCLPQDRFYGMIHALFSRRDEWLLQNQDAAIAGLTRIAIDNGHTEASFESCLADQSVYDAITFQMDQADQLGLTGTPTFFINGERVVGEATQPVIDAIERHRNDATPSVVRK